MDEIDALMGDTLLAVLRQLRAGYPNRPRRFPQSVILCGVRDVRDLSLVTRTGPVAIANPIYREVIPRDVTYTTQEMSIHHDPAWYVDEARALQTE